MNYKKTLLITLLVSLTGFSLIEARRKSKVDEITESAFFHLEEALGNEDHDQVKALVDAGADINELGESFYAPKGYFALIHQAASLNRINRVQILLECGANVNVLNKDGKTAFDMAVHSGYTELMALLKAAGGRQALNGTPTENLFDVLDLYPWSHTQVQKLIDAGAKVNQRSNKNPLEPYPLMKALIKMSNNDDHDPTTIKILLKAGAKVNQGNDCGDTPLMFGIGCGPKVTKLLLDAGAHTNNISPIGGTSLLHSAVSIGDPEVVKLLLKAGDCSINKKDGWDEETPLDLARVKEVKDILIAHGAKCSSELK